MRRPAGLLVALLLLLGAAPAAVAAPGEIVFIADGPAYGTISLRDDVRLDWWRAKGGSGKLAMIVVTRNGGVLAAGAYAPSFDSYWRWTGRFDDEILAGESTVRMVTHGRTIVRVPATGLYGVKKVYLTKRLQGATTVLRRPAPRVSGIVEDDISFSVRGGAVVVHGVTRSYRADAVTLSRTCALPADQPCPPIPWARPGGLLYYEEQHWHDWEPAGAAHAYTWTSATGVDSARPIHYLLAVPVA